MFRGLVLLGVALALIGGLAYWRFPDRVNALLGREAPASGAPAGAAAGSSRPAVPVTAVAATIKAVPIEIRGIGTVQPFATVEVKSRVDGMIAKVHFKEGDMVQAGDPLFTIDPRSFEAQLRQSEANLMRDQAQLANARTEVRRLEATTPSGITPQRSLDQARTNAASLEATVKATEAAIEIARVQLSYTDIRAPITGRTGELRANEGNLVRAQDAEALVRLNQLRPINVNFAVPERHLPEIRARHNKAPLKISLIDNRGVRHPELGELAFIDNAIDAATGTIQLKGVFENDRDFLWPGQFMQVMLQVSTRDDAVVLPTQAIQTGQQGQYVYVVRPDRTAELRPVRAGPLVDAGTIIEEGVQPGELVVTDGHIRIVPDGRVTLRGEGQGGTPAASPAQADPGSKS